MCHFHFPGYICPCLPEWTFHTSSSCCLEDGLWTLSFVPNSSSGTFSLYHNCFLNYCIFFLYSFSCFKIMQQYEAFWCGQTPLLKISTLIWTKWEITWIHDLQHFLNVVSLFLGIRRQLFRRKFRKGLVTYGCICCFSLFWMDNESFVGSSLRNFVDDQCNVGDYRGEWTKIFLFVFCVWIIIIFICRLLLLISYPTL